MSRIEQLKDFLKESPEDSFLRFALAKEYEKSHQTERALAFFTQIANDDPEYVGLYYHLGKLYLNMGEVRKSFDTYTKGMEVARSQDDKHALSELVAARMEIDEDELD
ncbi:MAG: tetratricopeptide repeat protein [Bacteroidia bacterium]|nr:tetratricopeptide repeat protein [Bacteroidia bacterium]